LNEIEHFSKVSFSPDSERLAYTALKDDKWVVVNNGKTGPKWDQVMFMLFSPDSKRFAYAAKQNNQMFLITDGKVGNRYEKINNPVFSPDSKHIAYMFEKDGMWSIAVD
jgi:Tol biopolymer transport system component